MDDGNFPLGHNKIQIAVVKNAEQMGHALAIRAICMFEDAGLDVDQAFDGNDYQATHIIVYSGKEPIGASRIRWFHEFAEIERTCFRKAYRDPRILRDAARFVFNHAAVKGYSTVITHAEPKLALLWKRMLGFREIPNRPVIKAGNTPPYIGLFKQLDVPEHAISLRSDPRMLFRTEGYWHEPGAFEKNA
jgi:hypothetical protein